MADTDAVVIDGASSARTGGAVDHGNRTAEDVVIQDGIAWKRMPDGSLQTLTYGECALAIERLRSAIQQACSDMGCFCKDDRPLEKCPMCMLEKALYG